jgi:hypothetical protein
MCIQNTLYATANRTAVIVQIDLIVGFTVGLAVGFTVGLTVIRLRNRSSSRLRSRSSSRISNKLAAQSYEYNKFRNDFFFATDFL